MKRILIVFEDQARLNQNAWEFKPDHLETQTLIRNGSVHRYQSPVVVIDLVANEMGLKGMKPDEIQVVGILGRGMRKAVETLEAHLPK